MKRAGAFFVVLVVGLSVALYLKLRQQRLDAERPPGGSATIEGVEVDVVSRLATRIVAIHVDEGDSVKKGDLLVELDCREPEAMLAQAEAGVAGTLVAKHASTVGVEVAEQGVAAAQRKTRAARAQVSASEAHQRMLAVQLDAAKRSSERVEKVHARGAASEQVLDRINTEVAGLDQQIAALQASVDAADAQAAALATGVTAARKQVALARIKAEGAETEQIAASAARDRAAVAVSECRLVAPRDGYVQTRNFEPGEVVMPGSRILTLVDTREVDATFYLPNQELDAAKVGRPVSVHADPYPDQRFDGAISRVAVSAEFTPRNVQTREDRDRLVYAVEVKIPNQEGLLRPGMPVEISVDRGAGASVDRGEESTGAGEK